MSLSDAAIESGISYENARQRLKTIFQKTGTRSQSELRVLLAQF
jgi:DNA-binding CsgD family transcriptional regulator